MISFLQTQNSSKPCIVLSKIRRYKKDMILSMLCLREVLSVFIINDTSCLLCNVLDNVRLVYWDIEAFITSKYSSIWTLVVCNYSMDKVYREVAINIKNTSIFLALMWNKSTIIYLNRLLLFAFWNKSMINIKCSTITSYIIPIKITI